MIQYDLIVQELSKGLTPLSSSVVLSLKVERFKQLMEFRTIKYGSCRQSGNTESIGQYCQTSRNYFLGDVLYLHLNSAAVEYFKRRFVDSSTTEWLDVMTVRKFMGTDYNKKYSTVFIDDSWLAASKVGINKIYRQLANIVTDDVVIHLVN